jgi:long-subunit fatty acid transport protein
MKRIALTTVIATAVLAASVSSAAAAQITVSAPLCPDGYTGQWVAAGTSGDTNKNGAVCVKAKRTVDDYRIVTFTLSIESGGCASGYYAISSYLNPSYDANQNSVICFNPTGKGSWKDDITLLTGLSVS